MLTLMEELLLLALNDEKGNLVSSATALPYGLNGAILLELALAEKIDIDNKKLVVIAAPPTGNDLLDKALGILAGAPKNKPVKYWVVRLSSAMKGLKNELLEKLIEKEILVEQENKILWVIPVKRYPAKNAAPENAIRNRIRNIVLNGQTVDERSSLLISLIHACSLVNEIFEKDERRAAKKRIKEIGENEKVGKAITDTVNEAVMVAVSAAAIASVTTSTST